MDRAFCAQPETERYLNRVADKHDLRRDIQFNARVKAASWDEDSGRWAVMTEDGGTYRRRFLITAIGALSTPTMPNFPGMDAFAGQSFHTGLWPKEPVDFAGKRVAVIGTGATGVQTIQEVAKTAAQSDGLPAHAQLVCAVAQRQHHRPRRWRRSAARYDDIFGRCAETFSCFLHTPHPRNTFDVHIGGARSVPGGASTPAAASAFGWATSSDMLTDRAGQCGSLATSWPRRSASASGIPRSQKC